MVIIVLAVIGGGVIWLYSHKKSLDREARAFGREAIQKMAVDHDISFFRDHLSPQSKMEYPPSQQDYVASTLRAKGVPKQPMNIEEQVTFESQFFEPKGYFTAHLFYPSGPATMQIAISHPVGKWQLDNFTFQAERPPR